MGPHGTLPIHEKYGQAQSCASPVQITTAVVSSWGATTLSLPEDYLLHTSPSSGFYTTSFLSSILLSEPLWGVIILFQAEDSSITHSEPVVGLFILCHLQQYRVSLRKVGSSTYLWEQRGFLGRQFDNITIHQNISSRLSPWACDFSRHRLLARFSGPGMNSLLEE